jgi:ABC-type phosphate/phosphonate transport system permease subunit
VTAAQLLFIIAFIFTLPDDDRVHLSTQRVTGNISFFRDLFSGFFETTNWPVCTHFHTRCWRSRDP